MDVGPVVQPSQRSHEPDAEHLGLISPELALVDPVLAEQARKLLPDPPDVFAPRAAVVEGEAPSASRERPRVLPPLAPRPRRRWPQTIALAVLVFAAGAVSGGLLRDRRPAPSRVALELRTAAPVETVGAERPPRPPASSHKPPRRAASSHKPPRRTASSHKPPRRAAAGTPQRAQSESWAANVLGVAAQVAGPGVKLVWQRPAGSDHVVVLRALGNRQRGTVVFRGHATSFRDLSSRPCTAYRYTIVNYDRRRHRSTGVPTSVVTGGCT
jgi:hypothetical protein